MFEMFAVICMLSWPDDTMRSQLDCSTFYEDPPAKYSTRNECEEKAYDKLAETIKRFDEMKVEFQSIQVGCKK